LKISDVIIDDEDGRDIGGVNHGSFPEKPYGTFLGYELAKRAARRDEMIFL
jgi:hypothetical protein